MMSQSVCLIPGLPYEIAIICFLKISVVHRHRISCVCCGWRELFREEYFWEVRRKQSARETLLLLWSSNQYRYEQGVWHGFYPATKEWIRLPLMPMDKREKGYSTFAVVDEKLFVIGGEVRSGDNRDCAKSSMVSYFDLKRWEWKDAGPLNLARRWCRAGVLNGLLYVFGGQTDKGLDQGLTSTAEVYNPVTKTWKFVSSMAPSKALQFPMFLADSIVVAGKVYVVNDLTRRPYWDEKGVVYSPQEDEWTEMAEELNRGWSNKPVEFNGQICIRRESSDGREGCVLAYDPDVRMWKLVHGQRVIENEIDPWISRRDPRSFVQVLNLDGSL